MASKEPRTFIRIALFLTEKEYEDLDKKMPMRHIGHAMGVWTWLRERLGWNDVPFGWYSTHRIISESEYLENRKG